MISFNKKSNTLYISGAIEGAHFFKEGDSNTVFELSQYDTTRALNVVINSPGGSTNEGLAIKTFLESLEIQPRISVTGLAASAATLITSAKNAHVTMQKGSMFMIHEPWITMQGAKDDLKKTADRLDKLTQSIAQLYAEKTNLPVPQLIKMMSEETWLTADEAVELGFADKVDGTKSVNASIDNNKLSIGGLDFSCATYCKLQEFFQCHQEDEITMNEEVKTEDKNLTVTETKSAVTFTDVAQMIKAYPDFCRAIADEAFAKGQSAERERIKELDAMSSKQHESLINKAKYETFEDAKSCAFNILKAQKQQLDEQASALQSDASALQEVAGVQEDVMTSAETQRNAMIKSILENM